MMLSHFINKLRDWLEPEDDTTVVEWVLHANNMAAVTETGFNDELLQTLKTLEYVKNNFQPEVFQKTLRFPTLYNEIVNVALCYNAGFSTDDVTYFANNGHIECGYVPHFEDEHASFTIVNITEPESTMAVFIHMSNEHIRLTLQGANKASQESGLDLTTVLRQGFRAVPQRVFIIESDDLKTAFKMSTGNTKCFREQYDYNPTENTMRAVTDTQDETLTAAESPIM